MDVFIGLMIPFLGTALGAACVFFMKKELSVPVQKALTGFAAGCTHCGHETGAAPEHPACPDRLCRGRYDRGADLEPSDPGDGTGGR